MINNITVGSLVQKAAGYVQYPAYKRIFNQKVGLSPKALRVVEEVTKKINFNSSTASCSGNNLVFSDELAEELKKVFNQGFRYPNMPFALTRHQVAAYLITIAEAVLGDHYQLMQLMTNSNESGIDASKRLYSELYERTKTAVEWLERNQKRDKFPIIAAQKIANLFLSDLNYLLAECSVFEAEDLMSCYFFGNKGSISCGHRITTTYGEIAKIIKEHNNNCKTEDTIDLVRWVFKFFDLSRYEPKVPSMMSTIHFCVNSQGDDIDSQCSVSMGYETQDKLDKPKNS